MCSRSIRIMQLALKKNDNDTPIFESSQTLDDSISKEPENIQESNPCLHEETEKVLDSNENENNISNQRCRFDDNNDNDPDYMEDSDDSSTDENQNNITMAQNENYENVESSSTQNVSNTKEEVLTKKIKLRKRLRKIEEWRVTKRMKETLSGKKHKSKSGKVIGAKSIKPGCGPCKKKCTEKISENVRKEIFQRYWSESMSWDLKRQYILSHVTSKTPARKRPKTNSRHDKTRTIVYDFQVNGETIYVCKVFFLNTLGISETVVRNVLKKQTTGGFLPKDRRGRHVPPNKLSENVLDRIRAHIKSFPIYSSHYSRERTSKSYLGSDLNQEKMYKLYLTKCEEELIPQSEIAKYWAYKRVFQTEFNLGFKKPSNDTCDKCDNFTLQLKESRLTDKEKLKVQQAYEIHLEDANNRYRQKREDKERSKSATNTKVIMIDLQKCLPTPYLTNAESFYLLKLWTFNLTIYDATANRSHCLIWDESQANRGGNEIASALMKWANINLSNNANIKTLIIWSDNCPSQNRNVIMMMSYFWLFTICPNLKSIKHKFLLRGHTHLEADHVHGVIERALRKQPTMKIVTPWDWKQLILSTGTTVYDMSLDDFKNFETLYSQPGSAYVNRKRNTERENFLISSVVWLEARVDSLKLIYYKTSFEQENFKTVDLCRLRRGTLQLPSDLHVVRQNPKPINKNKYDHLQTLLQWVPPQFHDFYKNLVFTGQNDVNTEDDLG